MKLWKVKYVGQSDNVENELNNLQKQNVKIISVVYNHTTLQHEIFYTVEEENN